MRRFILVLLFASFAGLAFAPTGVPLNVFSQAEPSKIPTTLLSAAKSEGLDTFAARLAVQDIIEPRGPGVPQPETFLTYLRGRVFSGKEQMTAFALERAYIAPGIQGWEAAITYCFEQGADGLSLADAVMIIIQMRSPSRVWVDQADEFLERRNAFLSIMAEDGYAATEEVVVAIRSPVEFCTVKDVR